MKFQTLFKSIATLGPLGYHKASGTIGSFVALFGVYLLHNYVINMYFHVFLIFIFALFGLVVINRAFRQFESNDPKEIIIDEVIGCFVVFCGLPFNILIGTLGFLIFRFFDITKFLGISYLEKNLHGSWGILLDDLAAALIANIAIRFIIL